MTKIAISIASDHGGYPLKKNLIKIIQDEGYNVIDKGAYNYNPEDDYPDFAKLVAESVQSGETNKGIILCDDYDLTYAPGVKKAIDEYILSKNFNLKILCSRFAEITLRN